MTVAELIEKLREMPQDLDVIYKDGIIGPDVIEQVWLQLDPPPRCVVLE